jgi:N-acetylglucosamine-6-phosphate deacetylase
VLTILALATFAGSWSRMTGASEDAVRKVNSVVKIALAPSNRQMPDALKNVPDFRAQVGHTYWLSQQASSVFPTGIDVQVAFDNGYVLTCLVETETGQARIITCSHGDQSAGGPASSVPYQQQR